jgi:N-acetylglucosaminyltransferase
VFDAELLKNLLLYIPLSIIGLWRWSFWVVRRVCAWLYRPKVAQWPDSLPKLTVSVVTPVYNEDPVVFDQAVKSWIKNGVDEIIAVIDKTNTHHIIEFERKFRANKMLTTKFKLIVTPKPGKRAALCDGIEHAKGDIIVLVDSDTVWSDDVLEKTLPYFVDAKVGGATVAQRIQNPDNVANVMFDMLLWTRYKEEVPFLLGVGRAFNTLSGRTAFYRREAIFNDDYDNLHSLRHEFFLGTRGVSGDDKRLTHLIVEQGWHTAFVTGPTVYTPGLNSTKTFLKQRLRWVRNSWRADLRAVGRGWVWAHPALALFMIDRFVQPAFMLIGPVVMVIALIHHEWLFAGILLAWWIVSRFIRVFGYFRAYPSRVIYLPAYIVYGYINSVLKIYAFATLLEHSWATRWHKNRAKRKSVFRKGLTLTSGYTAIAVFIFFLSQVVFSLRDQAGASIPVPEPVVQTTFETDIHAVSSLQQTPPSPSTYIDPTQVETYTVQDGDTLAILAAQFGMNIVDLKKLNSIRDPDKITAGQQIIHFKGSLR